MYLMSLAEGLSVTETHPFVSSSSAQNVHQFMCHSSPSLTSGSSIEQYCRVDILSTLR